MSIRESTVEDAALGWFQNLCCAVLPGPYLGPGEPVAKRMPFRAVVLVGMVSEAIRQLNPAIPLSTLATLLTKLLNGELMVADFISGLLIAI